MVGTIRRTVNTKSALNTRSANARNANTRNTDKRMTRRIISLIVQLITIYYLSSVITSLSPMEALKVRDWLLKCFLVFKNITKYFIGREKVIEAGASAIFAVVWRKLQMGQMLDLSNIPVAAAGFTLAYYSGTNLNSSIKMITKYNNSFFARMIGITERNSVNVQKAIVAMISWLLSSLRYSTIVNVSEISKDIMIQLRLKSLRRRNMINYGRSTLITRR